MGTVKTMETIGPGYWDIIHRKSLLLSVDEFEEFIEEFLEMIPCDHCRDHALRYLRRYRPSRYEHEYHGEIFVGNLIWTIRLHNSVNRRLGKPEMTISRGLSRWLKPDDCHVCSIE